MGFIIGIAVYLLFGFILSLIFKSLENKGKNNSLILFLGWPFFVIYYVVMGFVHIFHINKDEE